MRAVKANKALTVTEIIQQRMNEQRPRIDELSSTRIFPDNGPMPKTLTEISGAPNSGKTFLLQELMLRCLPPPSYGGKNCDIIFLNLSKKFNVQLFAQRIRELLKASDAGKCATSAELVQIEEDCLDAVKVLNCSSPDHVELAIETMDQHMLVKNCRVAMIAVDTLCEFYWMDAKEKHMRLYSYYMQWVGRLRQLCRKYNVCCIYTVDCNFAEATSNVASSSISVDYRIKLMLLRDGRRSLNGHTICIDDDSR